MFFILHLCFLVKNLKVKFQATVIISFYNKSVWLELMLAALERQTLKAFEVIVADDGSCTEEVEQVKNMQASSTLVIQHLWHPDEGFRKTIMLNKAIVASRSDYLIFIDGDCIPHYRFVEDHLRLKKKNCVLAGRRVNMDEKISKTIITEKMKNGLLEHNFFLRLLWSSVTGSSKDVEKGIHVNTTAINTFLGTYKKTILGCNFSISKNDLLELNGFDERFRYPGVGEDTEINFRINNKGMQVFQPKFALVQYHLWHPRLSREKEPENLALLKETLDNKYIETPYGIDKTLYKQ